MMERCNDGLSMKVLSVVGARPQFVKAAVVSKRLRESGFEEQLLHTGQHYDFNMSEVFFRELELPEPNHYLGIGSGRHGEQTARMLTEIEDVLLREDPDLVLVYGDTNSTLAGALAPVKLHIPVAHVEAGLRSYNRQMPEEVNRVVTDHCSSILFCPTETAVRNLQAEGFRNVVADSDLGSGGEPLSKGPLVANVGDVMLDIAQQTDRMLASRSPGKAEVLERFNLRPREYVLATIHRASNTDEERNLRGILTAMQEVAQSGLTVLFPIHPRTRRALERFDLSAMLETDGLVAGDPVSYMDMIALESQARLLLTDSGGVQKEAYFFGVPCVVAREETEWTELVEIGWNRIAGAETGRIVEAVRGTLAEDFSRKSRTEFYGDGHAAKRIAAVLRSVGSGLYP